MVVQRFAARLVAPACSSGMWLHMLTWLFSVCRLQFGHRVHCCIVGSCVCLLLALLCPCPHRLHPLKCSPGIYPPKHAENCTRGINRATFKVPHTDLLAGRHLSLQLLAPLLRGHSALSHGRRGRRRLLCPRLPPLKLSGHGSPPLPHLRELRLQRRNGFLQPALLHTNRHRYSTTRLSRPPRNRCSQLSLERVRLRLHHRSPGARIDSTASPCMKRHALPRVRGHNIMRHHGNINPRSTNIGSKVFAGLGLVLSTAAATQAAHDRASENHLDSGRPGCTPCLLQ